MTSGGRTTRAALLAIALAATAACGSSGGSNGNDAGAGVDGSADAASTAFSCDPAAQDCPAGMKCDFYCDGTALVVGCRLDPGGGGDAGVACSAADFCARGSGCLTVAGSTASCKRFCVGDSDCPGQRCHQSTVGVNCGAGTSTVSLKVCY